MVTWCKSYRDWAHFSDDLPQSPLVISTLRVSFYIPPVLTSVLIVQLLFFIVEEEAYEEIEEEAPKDEAEI
ncbi:hypothetical protein H5410_034462 [Solanum commersonii]|uniref:Uncharacterized protein n=1 Tax=Solanum commersonii TaxID=4109 RepID=A0A9J5YVK8_SOLCO|nr:hypothetical protein H5410_034462 [Solanum commersonii]